MDGAERIAKIAAQAGVPRFIHVSHLNASPNSTSAFYKSRFEGEEKVKEAYPGATIVRPAAMYGYEDRFLNNMASTFCSAVTPVAAYSIDPQFGPSGGSSTT